MEAERYIQDTEDGNWGACLECATENGYTKNDAEDCDNCALMCRGCPFMPERIEADDRLGGMYYSGILDAYGSRT
jgi:hypothetical protein